MGSRTYLPTLARILHRVCIYIVQYRNVMVDHLPDGGAAALDAIVVACEAFMALYTPDEGG